MTNPNSVKQTSSLPKHLATRVSLLEADLERVAKEHGAHIVASIEMAPVPKEDEPGLTLQELMVPPFVVHAEGRPGCPEVPEMLVGGCLIEGAARLLNTGIALNHELKRSVMEQHLKGAESPAQPNTQPH